jgi:ankyrin repeat protein
MNLNRLFIEASKLGILPVVRQLVEAGANVRADNDYALRWAAEKGHLETVKYLVSVGANVRARDDWALRYAAEKGHTEVLDYLNSEIEKLQNSAKVL